MYSLHCLENPYALIIKSDAKVQKIIGICKYFYEKMTDPHKIAEKEQRKWPREPRRNYNPLKAKRRNITEGSS